MKEIVLVIPGPKLSKEEARTAFAIGEGTVFWRGLMQRIEEFRAESQANAAAACGDNNNLGMAAAVGAVDVLQTLMLDLQAKRREATKE